MTDRPSDCNQYEIKYYHDSDPNDVRIIDIPLMLNHKNADGVIIPKESYRQCSTANIGSSSDDFTSEYNIYVGKLYL